MWYIVVVFFNSGLITGPAHFEEGWYPRPLGINSTIGMCKRIGTNALDFLRTDTANLRGEAFEVACINAETPKELSDIIHGKWTFEPAPAPYVPDAPA